MATEYLDKTGLQKLVSLIKSRLVQLDSGVSGTLPVSNGGTGASDAENAMNNLGVKTWLLNNVFKVGYVWVSYTSTSPASILGGTWTPITGRFPYFNAGADTGGASTHSHGLSSGAAMIDLLLRPENPDSGWLFAKTNSTHKWSTSGVPAPEVKRYVVGESGSASEDFTGNYLTKLYGNSNSASTLPPYQTLYAWRRTA